MAYEIIITPEQYDNVLKRVFTKGYTTEYYKDSETDIIDNGKNAPCGAFR